MNKDNKKISKSTRDKLVPNGICYNCCKIINEGKIFCSSICAEQYEIEKRLENKNKRK